MTTPSASSSSTNSKEQHHQNSPPIFWNETLGLSLIPKYIYQQVLGTPFDENKVKKHSSTTNTISTTYSSIVEHVSLVKAAYGTRGQYRYYWKKFAEFLQQNPIKDNEHLYLCPGTHGESSDCKECAPWVDKNRAYDFLDHLSVHTDKKSNVLKKHMDALNFLIKIQNQFIEVVFIDSNFHRVVIMDTTTGRSSVAINSKKMKEQGTYSKAVIQNQKMKSAQSDPQRGHINKPFDDNKLISINEWFFLNKKFPTFQAATLRFLFAWSHFALMRGDDLRTTDTSWGHSGLFALPEEYGPDRGYIFTILKDRSKTNKKGETHFAGCLRHKIVEVCPVNAAGELLILSIGRKPKRDFHLDIFNSKNDWINDKGWLVTNETGSSPLEYSKKNSRLSESTQTRKKKKVEEKNRLQNDEPLYHYDEFQKLISELDLEFCKVTHMRAMGCRYGQKNGAHRDELELLGRWIDRLKSSICQKHYMSNLAMEALLPMAGFSNPQNGSCPMNLAYKMPRGRSIDICNINEVKNDVDYLSVINYITPGLIERLERSNRAFNGRSQIQTDPRSMSNMRFCEFCMAATIAWIQDAVYMTEKYPDLIHREPYSWLGETGIHWSNRVRVRAATIAWIQDAVYMTEKYPDLIHREPYSWLGETGIHWSNIKERVGKAGEEIKVDLSQVVEDRRVTIAHFDNVAEKLLSTMNNNFRSVQDEMNILKEQMMKTSGSENIKRSFHCMLQSLVPDDVQVLYRDMKSGQILEESPDSRSNHGGSMSSSSLLSSSSSRNTRVGGYLFAQEGSTSNTESGERYDPSTSTGTSSNDAYHFKKPKEYGADYIKGMVMEWHDTIVATILSQTNQGQSWYNKKQKQLKEKHQLVYDAVKNSIDYDDDNDNLNQSQKLRHKCNELQNLLEQKGGCFSDVEQLCRAAKKARNQRKDDFDILDEQQLVDIISSRKNKQNSKKERRNQEVGTSRKT